MKRAVPTWAVLVATLFISISKARAGHGEDYPEMIKETIRKTLSFANPAGVKLLSVDNNDGSIHVTGYEGTTVQVDIVKTIRARSQNDAQIARKEVALKISEKDNRIELYVDGPFRCDNGTRRSRRFFYWVTYDFEIRVPRTCDLDLRTVNNGDIRAKGVNGKFDIENINGKVQMEEVAGSGRLHSINSGIKAAFVGNPAGDCSFDSLNGNLELVFDRGLSADCWFQTFNGDAYTDFNIQPLLRPGGEQERKNGRYVYRSNRNFGVRIGNGGPQLKFKTLNGNIYVRARQDSNVEK